MTLKVYGGFQNIIHVSSIVSLNSSLFIHNDNVIILSKGEHRIHQITVFTSH